MDTQNPTAVLGGHATILTQRGEVPVGTLRPGDEAVALGLTGLLGIAATAPDEVAGRPAIRIGKDAIGPREPRRDTVVSADSLLVLIDGDGAPRLLRAEQLVNAATIARTEGGLWQMRLAQREPAVGGSGAEVILVDGLRLATAPGLPEAGTGELQRLRTRLRSRAEELGAVPAAHQDVHLTLDGQRIEAARRGGAVWQFELPSEAREVRICSTSGVPAEMDVTSEDHRRLGIGVGRLNFSGASLALDGDWLLQGWYDLEREGDTAWRWTDGRALLRVTGPGVLEIEVARAMVTWATPETADPLPPAEPPGPPVALVPARANGRKAAAAAAAPAPAPAPARPARRRAS